MTEELIREAKRQKQEKQLASISEYISFLLQENRSIEQKLEQASGLLRAWQQYCIDTKGRTPLHLETAQFLKEIEK